MKLCLKDIGFQSFQDMAMLSCVLSSKYSHLCGQFRPLFRKFSKNFVSVPHMTLLQIFPRDSFLRSSQRMTRLQSRPRSSSLVGYGALQGSQEGRALLPHPTCERPPPPFQPVGMPYSSEGSSAPRHQASAPLTLLLFFVCPPTNSSRVLLSLCTATESSQGFCSGLLPKIICFTALRC